MYDRIADFAMPRAARYPYGDGSWRFSDARSAQLATSDRERIGGQTMRCSTPSQSPRP